MFNTKQFLTVAALLIAGMVSGQGGAKVRADGVLAVVGDRIILNSDIYNQISDAKRGGQEVPPGAECMLLEQSLISKVMMLQAEKDSLPVTDEEIEAELDKKVRYFINQLGSQEAVEQYSGKTIFQLKDDSRQQIREQMLAQAMQQKIVGAVKITPTEVKTFFDRIPTDSLPYFESELEVGQIVVYPKASRDLEQYIIGEMNKYKTQVEQKKYTFEELAQRYSEDPGSKERGGFYQLNRNEKTWDPVFLSTAFRLKDGEISAPVKGKFGYHIIQMVKRNGDDADVRHILRTAPITNDEITMAKAKLDSIRSRIEARVISFNEAATKFSDDEAVKFQGAFVAGRDGSTYVTIDQLDKEMVAQLRDMKIGDISRPVAFTGDQDKKGVRIVYLKSRSEPHVMNMRDDYSKIAIGALEEKKKLALDKWLDAHIPNYYINVDNSIGGGCPAVQKYESQEVAAQ